MVKPTGVLHRMLLQPVAWRTSGAHDVGDPQSIGLAGLVVLRRHLVTHMHRFQADGRQAEFLEFRMPRMAAAGVRLRKPN